MSAGGFSWNEKKHLCFGLFFFFLDTAEIYPHNVAYVLFNTTAVSDSI